MKSEFYSRSYLQINIKFFLTTAILAVLTVLSTSASAQQTMGRVGLTTTLIDEKATLLAASADLDQCANGDTILTHIPCAGSGAGSSGWVNGNVNGSKAHWAETQSLAYRMKFQGLSLGSHTVNYWV
jgi:hypothetical protein